MVPPLVNSPTSPPTYSEPEIGPLEKDSFIVTLPDVPIRPATPWALLAVTEPVKAELLIVRYPGDEPTNPPAS